MLQEMRKYTKSWISSLFLGALMVSFALWGIADIFKGGGDGSAFSIGSTSVPIQAFQRDFQNQTRRLATALPPDEQKLLGQQVLDRLTTTTALDLVAGDLGLTASDARVRDEIQSIPQFNGPLGSFDHDAFIAAINRIGFSEAEFIEQARHDAARAQLLRGVQGGFIMPADYARAIYAFINETRAAEYIVLSPAALGNVPGPSDAELAAYVKAHPDRFSTPEFRSVGVAWLSVDEIAPTIPITDKQIQDEIDAHRDVYITDEKREVEQLSFKSEAEAKAAKARLTGGKTFEALAADLKVAPTDYKLGDVVKADLDAGSPRATAAFSLPAGGISDPLKGPFGWVLLHVVKITPGSAKSHDEVKQALQRQTAWAKITDMANAYRDDVSNGDSIEVAARKAGLHYTHIAAMDAKGNGPDGNKAAPFINDGLLAEIAKADIGDDGDPFPTNDGHYFAVKVEGVTPPKPKPFDAVRAEATASWLAEKRAALLRVKAQALTAQANRDHTLAKIAAGLGLPVQASPALSRTTDKGQFNAQLVTALFAAPPGGVIFMPAADGTFVIARVSGIAHPAPAPGDMQFAQGVSQVSGEIANDLSTAMAKAEQESEGLSVNQKLIDQTVSGNQGAGP
jgi:peptidyl-prolyl cis-trans isomerase D